MFISNASIAAPAFTPAEHAVKQVRTQVPGYHRLMVGDFEVTALIRRLSFRQPAIIPTVQQ
ncbi:hypothetical protein [Neisseria sp. HMSC064F03]|uniref:hypothetical protein n=1 Tax=Neisseria sp. HMSC064F03 TaxID=1715037 RepID=UPI00114C9CE2|nr:hypothetical protein [Neisseria sp. HMSC064F03]